jgi:hypothetical protein
MLMTRRRLPLHRLALVSLAASWAGCRASSPSADEPLGDHPVGVRSASTGRRSRHAIQRLRMPRLRCYVITRSFAADVR